MTMLIQDAEVLEISDYGAGSKRLKNQRRKTSSIAKHSSSSAKFAALLQYFCTKTPAINVLELGTCLGVSTAFIQEAVKGEFFSFEGSTALAVKARAHFGLERVQFILGDIRKTLPEFLKTNPKIDFAWIDATHTYEGSMSYFNSLIPHAHEESIFVIGDIHWSKGMKKAWDTIKSHPKISCSFDFYECGVLFFKKGLMTQHYVLSI
ncbi:O-methyltransferase [Pararhodonellum marinum]|uniref:O-methyltransferase n=1 Tax=Pararhodonellum marinum TaxID=2755358 RepID=UPI00188FDC9B|nr:class I SAM-dependent methyltransferase [Pararhodonellum marinum]